MKDSFIKAAAGTPEIRVADCRYNAEQILALMRQAAAQDVRVLALPELCLTGSTCGDLFLQDTLLRGAEEGLRTVLEATKDLDMVAALGLPVRADGKLYNCAAVIHQGELLGLVPKTHLPNYGAVCEERWFSPPPEGELLVTAAGQQTILSIRQLFSCETMSGLTIGVELGEDLWAAEPPSVQLAARGATVILCLSAACETSGSAARRRMRITGLSEQLLCGYVYAGAGEGESTTDLVFTGHDLIAENGTLLAQQRFSSGLTATEIDVERLCWARRRMNTFPARPEGAFLHHSFALEPTDTLLTRPVSPTPFIPAGNRREEALDEILTLSALGLKRRLAHTAAPTAVIGLSGGLDSTLAILTTVRAFDLLHRERAGIIAVTMPCFGTTARTRSNAERLAEELGATLRVIDISAAVERHFLDIGQSMSDHSVTFENAQARERTQVLMDIANQTGGLVIGTGDLSELALGWCTYNGDHMSMYGVNGGIPKTLMRHLVSRAADRAEPGLAGVLRDILDTPVSPELLPPKDGEIAQKTEDLVGPYELHDFFLYYTVRWGFSPRKTLRLAVCAFAGRYDRAELLKWLRTFFRRFFSQQFKRSCMPDGPKVCEISLSPRGGWQMPSDAVAALWLDELNELEALN